MKFIVPCFKKGDVVDARVAEVLPTGHLIVEFQGDLIRVANQSVKKFQQGSVIQLLVRAIRPLSFQIYVEKRRSSLNVSV